MTPLYKKSENQLAVFRVVADGATHGATVAEIRNLTGLHHGVVSGALSILHRRGNICRLAESRHRCRVYVLPEHVAGRATERQGARKTEAMGCPTCGVDLTCPECGSDV